MVTHPSTNRAQRGVTMLIETNALPLSHTTAGIIPSNNIINSEMAVNSTLPKLHRTFQLIH